MPKEEWGVKRVCPTTGKRFYDLGRDPVVSPYTGEIVQTETGTKTRVAIKEEKVAKPEPQDDELLEDEDVLEDDDTDVDLGDDVLDDDDEDNVSLEDIADVGSEEDES